MASCGLRIFDLELGDIRQFIDASYMFDDVGLPAAEQNTIANLFQVLQGIDDINYSNFPVFNCSGLVDCSLNNIPNFPLVLETSTSGDVGAPNLVIQGASNSSKVGGFIWITGGNNTGGEQASGTGSPPDYGAGDVYIQAGATTDASAKQGRVLVAGGNPMLASSTPDNGINAAPLPSWEVGGVSIYGGGQSSAGGDVLITAGSPFDWGTNGDGGNVLIAGGLNVSAGSGGNVDVLAGGGAACQGGVITIAGGTGDSGGGDVNIKGGQGGTAASASGASGLVSGAAGGSVLISGGDANSAFPGDICITGGTGYAADGGHISMYGGNASTSSGTGGYITISTGNGCGNNGGDLTLSTGFGGGGGSGQGGNIIISCGSASSASGGNITITAGYGDGSSGGNISIAAGSPDGNVMITGGNNSGCVMINSTSGNRLGFFGSMSASQQTVTGDSTDGTLLISVVSALVSYGLIVSS